MKKGDVIKRRKRVMPAMPNQTISQPDSSVSPDPNPNIYPEQPQGESLQLPPANLQTSLPVHNRQPNDQERGHVLEPQLRNNGPPPVDFTALYSRKRTYPDAEGETQMEDRTTAGAPMTHRGPVDTSIDPTLAPGESKEQMRVRLQQERQRMRDQLMAVENELARMEKDNA